MFKGCEITDLALLVGKSAARLPSKSSSPGVVLVRYGF